MEHSSVFPMHSAVKSGNIHKIYSLLECGIKVNSTDNNGYTPLHFAAEFGYNNIIELLLGKQADIHATEHVESLQPIHLAVRYGHVRTVALLLNKGADLYSRPGFEFSILHLAAQEGQVNVLKYLVEYGMPVNYSNASDRTALHIAADFGRIQVIEFLLSENACTRSQDVLGNTALHGACFFGHLEAVKLLIEYGSDVNVKNTFGWTPIDFAASRGHKDTVEYLINSHFSKFEDPNLMYTIVRRATKSGHFNLIKYCFKRGFDVNSQGKDGYTALHIASRGGDTEIVEYLIQRGADINLKAGLLGYTSLHLACVNHRSDTLDFLIQNGADFEAKCDAGHTPLDLIYKALPEFLSEPEVINILDCAKVIIKYTVFRDIYKEPELVKNYLFQELLTEYRKKCCRQIEEMNCCKINNTTLFLYKFLIDTFDVNKLVVYLNNPELIEELQDVNRYVRNFSIYSNIRHMIKNNIKKGKEMICLLEQANKIFMKFTPTLPTECVYEIFGYLDADNLERFIQSF